MGDFVGLVGIALICLFYIFLIISNVREYKLDAVMFWGGFIAYVVITGLAASAGSLLGFILLVILGFIILWMTSL